MIINGLVNEKYICVSHVGHNKYKKMNLEKITNHNFEAAKAITGIFYDEI